MLETLDAAAVRRWCGGGLAALRAHQHEIDELNVYPVPDGDTGTNLVLTLTSAKEALEEAFAEEALLTQARAAFDEAAARSAEAAARQDAAGPASASSSDSGDTPRDPGSANASPASPGDPDLGDVLAGPDRDGSLTRPDRGGTAAGSDLEGSLAWSDLERVNAAGGSTPLGRAMRRMARGALLGARGNSGVIVSQILRGMADSFTASPVAVRGSELARALRQATDAAYAAVARPVEGTVLSVVAAAADGAGRIKSDDLLAVASAAARAASEALARTPQQLPMLARAGVVDAGGRGLCLLLDALVEALGPAASGTPQLTASAETDDGLEERDLAGRPGLAGRLHSENLAEGVELIKAVSPKYPAISARSLVAIPKPGGSGVDGGGQAHEHGGADLPGMGFEVQYLLDAEPGAVEHLRDELDGLGDSLVVVGTGEGATPTWNVHVHVPAAAIGPAVESGVRAGRPYKIKVTPLDEAVHVPDESRRGAVVVAAGDGLTALFTAEGATVVGRNPSAGEMIAAVEATGARSVVLLPNDANTHAVASSAAREAETRGLRVSVVPTRSPVQALAALAVRDTERPFADDVIAMAEAAGACRYGEVCTAQRDAFTVAGPCRAGDLLGLVDGEVHVIGADLAEVSRRLLDRMLGGGGELATLVLGADAPPSLEDELRAHVASAWPFAELQCYAGGQPRYHLLVGVE